MAEEAIEKIVSDGLSGRGSTQELALAVRWLGRGLAAAHARLVALEKEMAALRAEA